MKKMLKCFIPITIIGLIPTISMISCSSPDTPIPPVEHKVKIDPSSDTSNITISTPEIILSQQLTIPYEVTNPEKELDVDNSWLEFDSSQYPLNQFSYDNNQVIIPTEQVTTYDIVICLQSKQVTPPTPEPVADDFNTDSWATVCYYASQGFTVLKEAYSSWLSIHNTFLGANRDINFNGQKYEVKVIGIQQDFLDKERTERVTLTFQFNCVLSDVEGNALTTKWAEDLESSKNYWASTLHNFLNLDVYNKLIEENTELADQIKPVYREVNTKLTESWEPTSDVEHIFVLSISDMITKQDENQVAYYEWWQEHQTIAARTKNDKNNEPSMWWTTTISGKDDTFVDYITEVGGYGSQISPTDDTIGVAPCFCI